MGDQQVAKPQNTRTELPAEYVATSGTFALGDEIEPTLTQDEFFAALRRVIRPQRQTVQKADPNTKPCGNEPATDK